MVRLESEGAFDVLISFSSKLLDFLLNIEIVFRHSFGCIQSKIPWYELVQREIRELIRSHSKRNIFVSVYSINNFEVILWYQVSVSDLITSTCQTTKTGDESKPFDFSFGPRTHLITIDLRVILCTRRSVGWFILRRRDRSWRSWRSWFAPVHLKLLGGLDRFDVIKGFLIVGVLPEHHHGLAVAQVELLDVALGDDEGREGAGCQQGQQEQGSLCFSHFNSKETQFSMD